MTGALFWINVPFKEKKRQNKKQKKKLRTLLYSTYWTMSFGIFENITDLNKFRLNFHKTYYFHNIRLMIDFFFLRELIFFTEWKLPISLFDKIFTIASELIIKLTSIIFYILGYWLFSEFLFNFKTILLLDIFPSWTFD